LELNKIIAFLEQNRNARIELSGHTSSEGDRDMNLRLSFDRVNSCRDYIVLHGIGQGRILAKGYGPDRPIADNDTEQGRKVNRRVEMRVLEL
jgi:outer membrane protein OmpA-like peptidoglycan-associated protein